MKSILWVILVAVILIMCGFLICLLSPRILNSKIDRLFESGLPKAVVEKDGRIYCRMKADDFRFPLPPGSHALPPNIISGGFDWVDGSVEIRFDGTNQMAPNDYDAWLSKKVPVGASVTSKKVLGGLDVKFHYFGDK